jgi:hypothetical protein
MMFQSLLSGLGTLGSMLIKIEPPRPDRRRHFAYSPLIPPSSAARFVNQNHPADARWTGPRHRYNSSR